VRRAVLTKIRERQGMPGVSHSAEEGLRFQRKFSCRAVVPASHPAVAHMISPARQTHWIGPGKTFLVNPMSPGFVSVVALPAAETPAVEDYTSERGAQDLVSEFNGWDDEVRAVIRVPRTWLVFPIFDLRPLDSWVEGRVTLMGDAAHGMVPYLANGAGQAIEDAWVLGTTLARATRENVPELLRTYEMRRKPRVTTVQEGSLANIQRWEMPEGAAQRKRDAAMAADGVDDLTWLHGYDPDTDPLWSMAS
jgi:salicylate hydroxylase